ncbi:MAG: hypothetical protein ACKVXR_04725 [Planctomycetota bacterium]
MRPNSPDRSEEEPSRALLWEVLDHRRRKLVHPREPEVLKFIEDIVGPAVSRVLSPSGMFGFMRSEARDVQQACTLAILQGLDPFYSRAKEVDASESAAEVIRRYAAGAARIIAIKRSKEEQRKRQPEPKSPTVEETFGLLLKGLPKIDKHTYQRLAKTWPFEEAQYAMFRFARWGGYLAPGHDLLKARVPRPRNYQLPVGWHKRQRVASCVPRDRLEVAILEELGANGLDGSGKMMRAAVRVLIGYRPIDIARSIGIEDADAVSGYLTKKREVLARLSLKRIVDATLRASA